MCLRSIINGQQIGDAVIGTVVSAAIVVHSSDVSTWEIESNQGHRVPNLEKMQIYQSINIKS